MKIIFGLGNIGKEYDKTRHNAGFMVLDKFKNTIEKEENKELKWKNDDRIQAKTIKTIYQNRPILLVKPSKYMNLSGEVIKKTLSYYKEEIADITVVYDDIDLNLGKIRIRDKGSAGTHNGMKSIIDQIKSNEFTRIRIGIENRNEEQRRQIGLADYVLSRFKDEEISILEKEIEESIIEIKKQLDQ